VKRQTGIVAMIALSSFLLCGASSPTSCAPQHIGPSTGEVVGIGVAVGAGIVVGVVVLVEVNKSHHTIKGCVTAGPNGIQVVSDSDKKTYFLVGDPSKAKVGEVVRLRGTKEKKGSNGSQDFLVTNMTKDYGACKVAPAPSASAPAPPEAPKS